VIYEAALQALPKADFQVWKTRELAGLIMSKGTCQGQEVRCNIMISMTGGEVTVIIESEDMDQATLAPIAEKIINELAQMLA